MVKSSYIVIILHAMPYWDSHDEYVLNAYCLHICTPFIFTAHVVPYNCHHSMELPKYIDDIQCIYHTMFTMPDERFI